MNDVTKQGRGRPKGEETTVLNVRMPVSLLAQVDEDINLNWRGMVSRNAWVRDACQFKLKTINDDSKISPDGEIKVEVIETNDGFGVKFGDKKVVRYYAVFTSCEKTGKWTGYVMVLDGEREQVDQVVLSNYDSYEDIRLLLEPLAATLAQAYAEGIAQGVVGVPDEEE